ncbi:hypothetical protein GCM10027047_33540 [Rhodococcus aerolatus]
MTPPDGGMRPAADDLAEHAAALGLAGGGAVAAVLQDADGVLVDATAAALTILGLTRDQALGRTSLDPRWATVDEHGEPLLGQDHPAMRALRTGRPVGWSVLGVHRPGTDAVGHHVWIEATSTPLTGPPLPGGVVTAFRELPAADAAPRQRADAERVQRLLVDTTRDMVALVGLDGTFQWVSPAATRLLGLDPAQVVGTSGLDLVHPADLGTARAALAAGAAGGVHDPVLARLRHADGRWVWTETVVAVVTDRGGSPAQLCTASRDVSRRVDAEQAQRASDRLLASVLENAPVGIAVRPLDGTLTRVNRAMAEMLRRDVDELVGCNLADLVHPDHPGPVDDGVAALRAGAVDRHVTDWLLRRGDGTTMWGRRTAVLLRDDDDTPEHLLVQLEDVTEARATAATLALAAVTDPLTGLPHRAALDDVLGTALATTGRTGRDAGVLFVDLDDFKQVNDTLGHAGGDAVLREVARRLRSAVRAGDTVLRVGGDEFVVVCDGLHPGDSEAELVSRVTRALDAPVDVDGRPVTVRATVGVAVASAAAEVPTAEELLRAADRAMYAGKRSGRAGAADRGAAR